MGAEGALETTATLLVDDFFPESRGIVLSHLDLAAGVGIALGPLVGGIAFQTGGFLLPPVLCAVLLVGLAWSSCVGLHQSAAAQPLRESRAESFEAMVLVRQSDIWTFFTVAILSVTTVMLSNSFASIMSVHFVLDLHWKTGWVGLLYTGYGVARVFTKLRAEIAIGDAGWRIQQRAVLIGTLCASFGVSLFGSPGSAIDAAGVLALGVADGLFMAAALPLLSQSAPSFMLDQNESGEKIAAATLSVSFALGGAAGPLVGMPGSDVFGRQQYMLILGGAALVTALLAGALLRFRVPARVSMDTEMRHAPPS